MHDALHVTLILLASAVLVVVVFRRLSMPAIPGYVLVGVAVGPHALGLVAESQDQRYLVELGMVFLMFSAGLGLRVPQAMALGGRLVLGFGGALAACAMALGTAATLAAGLGWREGVLVGGALAMSSGAIVARALAERAELQSAHGRHVMAALLFQDLAVIPLLVLVPALAHGG
ncbi:MAG TPA: cation:proton antiporter, partial [Myxococcota bacterium]|nr:cation:proton antiporter [Myxococcota bacterium]